MGIDVRLHSSTKPNNSTRVLSNNVDYYARYDCQINAACSILNPVLAFNDDSKPMFFRLNGVDTAGSPFDVDHVAQWKYAYIGQWNRWYRVVDISYNRGIWYMSLSVDVLMSYRSTIGTTRQRIARSSKLVDPYLVDASMPITSRGTTTVKEFNFGSIFSKITGSSVFYYVLQVINSFPTSPRGMVTPYVLSYAQLQQFREFLLSEPSQYTGPITDVTDNMLKALFNPMQYIVSCKAYHFQPAIAVDSGNSEIRLGYWKTGIKCVGVCNGSVQEFSDEITLPNHPDYDQNRKYLNTSPYTTVRMELQPFYSGELDSTFFYNNRKIKCVISLDCVSGDAELNLQSIPPDRTDYVTFAVYYANLGIDIPVSQIMTNNFAADVVEHSSVMDDNIFSAAIESTQIQLSRIANRRAYGNIADPWQAASGWNIGGLLSTSTLTRLPLQDISRDARNAEYDAEEAAVNNAFSMASSSYSKTHAQNQLSAASARQPIASLRGSIASVAKMNTPKRVYIDYWRQPDVDETLHGRACAQYAIIGDIPGYIECVNPVFPYGLPAEQSEVLQYMSNGFYYE